MLFVGFCCCFTLAIYSIMICVVRELFASYSFFLLCRKIIPFVSAFDFFDKLVEHFLRVLLIHYKFEFMLNPLNLRFTWKFSSARWNHLRELLTYFFFNFKLSSLSMFFLLFLRLFFVCTTKPVFMSCTKF